MSLRIPHRRVSPRSRRRYRAIRNFFRKTLGSLASHSGIRINSSIAVNVTDLKHKFVGIKRHQNERAQNYRDGNLSRRDLEESIRTEENGLNRSPIIQRRQLSERHLEEAETKVLYKTQHNLRENSQDYLSKLVNELSDKGRQSSDRMNYEQYTASAQAPKRKSKRNKYDNTSDNVNEPRPNNQKRRNHTVVENSISGIGSYESLDLPVLRSHRDRPHTSQAYVSQQQDYNRHILPNEVQGKRRKQKTNRYKSESPPRPDGTRRNRSKNKSPPTGDNFITDIINRQYRPLNFFGRTASDYSKMSTPVCRDQRHSARELTIADSEVSTCYREPAAAAPRRSPCVPGVSGMRSVCDTRLYSTARPARRHRRRVEDYNDSTIYDVVPVKEKSSPKSRRKFIEDSITTNTTNEVPPSPRTQRPRLNLETRNYSDCEDYEQTPKQTRRRQSPYRRRRPEYIDSFRHDMSSAESQNGDNEISPKYVMRTKNTTRLYDDIGTTMSSQQYLAFHNNHTNVTLENSKAQEGDLPADKTDKALSEIKNILQSFLQELKKDSSTSQSDRTNESSNKTIGKELDGTPRGSGNDSSNAMKNSAASYFSCGLGQSGVPAMPPQFIAGFTNPCCYPPLVPMCGRHAVPCLHASCLRASPSCLCAAAACGHNHRATTAQDAPCCTSSKCNCTGEEEAPKKQCETDELIREIYNYVSKNPSANKKASKSFQDRSGPGEHKSMHAMRLDANVGTPPLKCYSRSCEAIASRQFLDTPDYAPYPCYSDSLIAKLSHEAMDYEIPPCETAEYPNRTKFVDQKRPNNANKFVSALRQIRKNLYNRKEVHEVCQSEQSIEVDVIPKTRQHFNQEYATYAMHGQEFLHPPPAPSLRRIPRSPTRFDRDYPPYNPRMAEYASPGLVSDRYDPLYDYMPPQDPAPIYGPQYPYEHQYRHMQPPPPLCLKEVEVRSIATQSEKKAPYFRVFQMKKQPQPSPQPSIPAQPPVRVLRDDRPSSNTQVFSDTGKPEKPRKTFTFNLKPPPSQPARPSLSERIQKDITKNDATMGTAMIKKLFHKRNPFSPQNQFIRTILEKDNTVYKWKPRLFV